MKTPGHPENSNILDVFHSMCDLLENESRLYTLEDLKCWKFQGVQRYSVKRIKQKLKKKYSDYIFFDEVCER